MKRFILFFAICVGAIMSATAQPTFSKYEYTLDFFLPKHFPDIKNGGEVKLTGKFNPNIPQPKDVLGYELGEFYPEWHAVLNYMNTLARVSDRVKIRTVETTYEKRPIIEVMISSPKNLARLDEIRAEHLKLSDASVSKSLDVEKMPVIVSHINSIHGNEQSAVCASLAVAYFYVASEDPTVLDILDNAVLLITPGINPDGINRFASWCNGESSTGTRIADVNTREYGNHEPKPNCRFNHYWHDGNRDLILTQHPEGRAFAKIACEWMPNLMYDNHEQGGSRGLYYSPGDLKRLHPLIPMEGQEKARLIGKYTKSILDSVNENSFSETKYDDFYLGRGDVYGDIQGIVNILIEQINSRGFVKPFKDGTLDFATSARNQAYVSIVSVFAAYQNRVELHNYQRDFFLRQAELIKQSKTQGYIFNTRGDRGLEYNVMEWMKNQRFDVYKLAKDVKVGKVLYKAEDSYIVPADQRYFLKFRGLWEDLTEFTVDNFYDVTTWSVKRAFNVQECEVENVDGLLGEKVQDYKFGEGSVDGTSQHGYLVGAKDFYSHNMLRAMLIKKVRVDIATKPFKVDGVEYGYGTAYIPLSDQPLSAEEIHAELTAAAKMNGVDVVALKKPLVLKEFKTLTKLPRVAMITGHGISANESGEIWFMLDRRFGLTPARIDITRMHEIKNFSVYDVIIVPSGRSLFPMSNKVYKRLKKYTELGGTVIAFTNARGIINKSELATIKFQAVKSDQPKSEHMYGIIVKAELDHTDPLGYGYEKDMTIPIFKRGRRYLDAEASTLEDVVMTGAAKPYLSGFVSQGNLDKIASNPMIMKKKVGKGTLIYSTESLTFRSYWLGSMKILMNSIYFGSF